MLENGLEKYPATETCKRDMAASANERHVATLPLENEAALNRGAWHPELVNWAIMWEVVLSMRRRWVEYYLLKMITNYLW